MKRIFRRNPELAVPAPPRRSQPVSPHVQQRQRVREKEGFHTRPQVSENGLESSAGVHCGDGKTDSVSGQDKVCETPVSSGAQGPIRCHPRLVSDHLPPPSCPWVFTLCPRLWFLTPLPTRTHVLAFSDLAFGLWLRLRVCFPPCSRPPIPPLTTRF